MGHRVLVTGADTFWGGHTIRAMEGDPSVELVLGMGQHDPVVSLERAEFIRSDQTYSILNRLVHATKVDTIIHTFLISDSTNVPERSLHEINVIGTMNLLAAAGATGSRVTTVVVKSSTKVYGATEQDPYVFSEEMQRSRATSTMVERSLIEAEALVDDFAIDHPEISVAVLRCANVLGGGIGTPLTRNLSRSFCPVMMGFDPLLQFVEATDVVRALEHAVHHRLRGRFNVAGDGRLPWSEVLAIAGCRPLPVPSSISRLLLAPLTATKVYELPDELVDLLRFGRGVDTALLKSTGFRYLFTSAGAVESFARDKRETRSSGKPAAPYRYEHDVEQFFRHSPAVVDRE